MQQRKIRDLKMFCGSDSSKCKRADQVAQNHLAVITCPAGDREEAEIELGRCCN